MKQIKRYIYAVARLAKQVMQGIFSYHEIFHSAIKLRYGRQREKEKRIADRSGKKTPGAKVPERKNRLSLIVGVKKKAIE